MNRRNLINNTLKKEPKKSYLWGLAFAIKKSDEDPAIFFHEIDRCDALDKDPSPIRQSEDFKLTSHFENALEIHQSSTEKPFILRTNLLKIADALPNNEHYESLISRIKHTADNISGKPIQEFYSSKATKETRLQQAEENKELYSQTSLDFKRNHPRHRP